MFLFAYKYMVFQTERALPEPFWVPRWCCAVLPGAGAVWGQQSLTYGKARKGTGQPKGLTVNLRNSKAVFTAITVHAAKSRGVACFPKCVLIQRIHHEIYSKHARNIHNFCRCMLAWCAQEVNLPLGLSCGRSLWTDIAVTALGSAEHIWACLEQVC